MRKIVSIAFCMLLLSSLLLTVGTAMAFTAGYEQVEYFAVEAITVDGKWTTTTEWSAGQVRSMNTPQTALFVYLMDASGAYSPSILVEFADSTPDAGDIIQVCMNGGVDASTPTADDFKIEIQGRTTKKVYQGTGTGWAESTTAAAAVQGTATVTTSAHDPANHVVAEIMIDKGTLAAWGANPPPEGFRVACYDASSDTWLSWPPASSADNPSTWGLINGYDMNPYPEVLTISVMLALSTVAAVVGIRYFRKPKL